jgi:class 3 adenylate cyclase
LACAEPLEQAPPAREVRKTVTVVFCDVVGSTALGERLDAESVRAVMGRYFDEMHAVLERHGGTVEKFIGDAVMAVFGIPVLHEDDALRAVRAAAEMRGAVSSLNEELERERGVQIELRIGVNTGEVVAGDPAGGQAFAAGDAVNVAARLEQAALPGEILIGDSTYRLVRDAVTVEAVAPLSLKGKGAAVKAVRLRDVAAVAGRRLTSPIVGRDPELELLDQIFDVVERDRTCQIVTIIGSAGVGKSRLVQEFLSKRRDEATIVRGRCLPYGDGITFWPIKEAVSQAAGLTGDESPQAAQDMIRSLIDPAADVDLIAERVAETIGVIEAAPGHGGHFWALGRLFEALARRRPVVAVFDDIHWAEPMFLELVEALAAQTRERSILIVCMARPELLDVRPSWPATAENARTLQLTPLNDDESTLLIANLLGESELPRDVAARIAETAEGNPLFVEEMVAMLLDEGVVDRRGRLAEVEDWSRISLPPSIQALLSARLDRLGYDERAVLERGSVEGEVFHRGAVLALSPESDRARLDAQLRTLAQQDLIRPGQSGFAGESAYRFHHELLRDVAYESLSKTTRAELHERYAVWLDDKAGDRADEFDELLGYHLQQAYGYKAALGRVDERSRELATRGGEHLRSAGLRAHARGDMWGARKLLSGAVELLPDDAVSRLEPALDDALFETGGRTRRRMSRASVSCYWSWPLGHPWEIKDRGGKTWLRCTSCGKVKRHWGVTGRLSVQDTEDMERRARLEYRASEVHVGGEGGGVGGGD